MCKCLWFQRHVMLKAVFRHSISLFAPCLLVSRVQNEELLKSSPWCQNLLADVKTICISLPSWMWYLSINDLVNYPSVWNRNIYIERIRKGLTMMISLLDFYLSRWLSSFCRLISLHVLMLWEELTCPEKMSPLVVNGDAHNWLLRK